MRRGCGDCAEPDWGKKRAGSPAKESKGLHRRKLAYQTVSVIVAVCCRFTREETSRRDEWARGELAHRLFLARASSA